MKVEIKKSGNSAALRIPSDVLKELNLSIGEELNMNIINNGLSFEKISKPREGWFDGISSVVAKNEAEQMEGDFGTIQDSCLDDWIGSDEW